MNLAPRNILLLTLLVLLLIGVPLTLSVVQKQQETKIRASGSTSLSLIPQPGPGSSIQKTVGDTIAIDMMVNPGSNLVTFIKFQVKYDPTKLQPVTGNFFTLNTTNFPTNIEGPVVTNGTIAQSVSVGSDPTKAIRTTTKVGTLNFKAIAGTAEPTVVTFTNISQALSSGPNDQAGENVLSTINPATINIMDVTTPTPTRTPTPTLMPNETALDFTLLLHGIGAAGDNPNPTGNTLSNKDPKHPQRDLTVEFFDHTNEVVATKSGNLVYNKNDGQFHGQVGLGTNFSSGFYTIKIKSGRHLRRMVPGILTVTKNTMHTIPVTQLVTGDTNDDNVLNVLDYAALLDCGYGDLNPLPLDNNGSTYKTPECQVHTPSLNTDIDDNGIINSYDYNLFLRELSVLFGD
jgi:hypothetical protein